MFQINNFTKVNRVALRKPRATPKGLNVKRSNSLREIIALRKPGGCEIIYLNIYIST